MDADGRCTRGFVALDLIRSLRGEARALATLTASDRQLITEGVELSAWLDQQQYLRLVAAAREHACDGDWSRLHELGAASVEHILELGYRAVVRVGDPKATFAAISVLWRASFNYGRAVADADAQGATIHVIDCPPLHEPEGNVHAGWCLGVARLIGADARVELRRRPWANEGDEQVLRLSWREHPSNWRSGHPHAGPRRLTKIRVRAVG